MAKQYLGQLSAFQQDSDTISAGLLGACSKFLQRKWNRRGQTESGHLPQCRRCTDIRSTQRLTVCSKACRQDFAELQKALTDHFEPKPLIIAERFYFHQRAQGTNEFVLEYVAELRRLATHCEFGAFLQDALRDRLVRGLRSIAAQKNLLSEENLSLEKAIRVAQSLKVADKNAKKFKADDSASTPIHRTGHYRYAKPPKQPANKAKTCYRCGDTDHIATTCRFRDAEYKKCHKKGHLARVCRSGSRPPQTLIATHPLQCDLNNLFTWSHTSELYFNDSKFAHIRFWSDQLTAGAVTYCVNRRPISSVDTIKDLGILLSSDLTWENHYNLILGKAYKILGLIRRTFSTNLVPVKKKLYISLIRSQLLYCSQVWRPFLIKHILLLERAQRRATKYILNDYCSSYKSRLLNLKLLPLMYIYELNDVIFFIKSYKSSFKHFNINDYIKFSESNTRSGTTSKMIHHRGSSNISHNSYFCRLPRLWNSLPPIDLTLPIPTIKHKLFIFLWNHFTKYLNENSVCTYPCCHCRCSGTRPPLLN